MNVDHLEPLCLHQPTTWNRTSTWMSYIKIIPNLDQCGILKPTLLIIFDLKTPHIISARKGVTWRTLGHWPRCGTTPALGRPVATLLGQQPPLEAPPSNQRQDPTRLENPTLRAGKSLRDGGFNGKNIGKYGHIVANMGKSIINGGLVGKIMEANAELMLDYRDYRCTAILGIWRC